MGNMPNAIILMYHNIATPPKNARIPNLYVTPRMFRFQMWYLKIAGFNVLSIKDLVQAVEAGDVTEKMVAITFDDGFVDFYQNAFPVLRRCGYPATVYVVSSLAGRDNAWDAKNEAVKKPLMTWDMVREVSRNGVEIGSHTRTHPQLTKLSGAALKEELAGSKQDIEEHLNRSVEQFCYPYGDFNDVVKNEVVKAGYQYAVVTQRGHVVKGNDRFALRRVPVKLITNPFSFFYKVHTSSEKRKGKQKE
jgi:peptidoglycan/xylan/chitin deacetylase (PgdA/CDA1 family)